MCRPRRWLASWKQPVSYGLCESREKLIAIPNMELLSSYFWWLPSPSSPTGLPVFGIFKYSLSRHIVFRYSDCVVLPWNVWHYFQFFYSIKLNLKNEKLTDVRELGYHYPLAGASHGPRHLDILFYRFAIGNAERPMLRVKIGWLDHLANATHQFYTANNTGGPGIKVGANIIVKN